MSGTRSVKVNVAWEIRQIGAAYPGPNDAILPGLPTERGQNGGGLIIVIDPTMTTNSTDSATRFLVDQNSTSLQSLVADLGLDPLRNLIATPPGVVTAFGGDRPSFTTELVPNLALTGNARHERIHACMNLQIAARNRFLVGIVGRARGWLRDKLAVYIVNPYHRYERNQFEPGYIAEEPNPPAIMVQGGSDIMRNDFQLPYVRYGVGGKGSEELNPFKTNPNSDDAARDRLLMGQLRDCYHLYHLVGSQGINRVLDPSTKNKDYESEAIFNTSHQPFIAPEYIPNVPPMAGTYPWDQEVGLVNPTADPLRSAEQVVAMLGSVQICPHGGASAGGLPCDESGAKPPQGEDLRGDIRAALMAVNGGRILSNGLTVPFPAYAPTALPGKGPSEGLFSKYASVLVVLSRPLAAEEIDGIKEQVQIFKQSPAVGRRILVAYFPRDAAEVNPVVLARLREAFGIYTPPVSPTPEQRRAYSYPSDTENLLFVFKPSGTTPSAVAFQTYWQRLLLPGHFGMSIRARSVFNYIFAPSPKL